jgi:hypothetical protein
MDRLTSEQRLLWLKLVLAVATIGHIVVGLSFWFFPHLAIQEILAWGRPSGWTSILGAYDVAVGAALFIAYRDPLGNAGLVRFAAILLALHAGTHAYYILWGDSPPRLWIASAYLALGSGLLFWLGPSVSTAQRPAQSVTSEGAGPALHAPG